MGSSEVHVQVLIVGGGTGGVAAALGAAAGGASVMLTEATAWIGGQLTSQIIPPDENPWIETIGGTRRYRQMREGVREWYRENRPLTPAARADKQLNPGGGNVSRLCHEPKVSLRVLEGMVAKAGAITVKLHHEAVGAEVEGDRVRAVTLRDRRTGERLVVTAEYVLDATELGDLLPLTKTEYVSGAESRKETGEPHALAGEAQPENVQAFTWCLAMGFDPAAGANHVADPPAQWKFWREYAPKLVPGWPGKLLSWTYSEPHTRRPKGSYLFPAEKRAGEQGLWMYRRIVRNDIYEGTPPHEVTVVNWPQNDYMEGNVIDKPAEVVARHLEASRQLSLSLLYWLQTEAPRPDGGTGYPGLYAAGDIAGTADGLAMAPYFRESRRIKARFTVTENHVGLFARYQHEHVDVMHLPPGIHAQAFPDSVGIGYYNMDLHPSTGGSNYIDNPALPFQIPLGALLPVRMENLLPACKNIGTTHITNGCYRLHPVEWNIGESAGLLAAFCIARKTTPQAVHATPALLADYQQLLHSQGINLEWPGAKQAG